MELPVKFGEILLPRKNVDMEKWCVVACDQYTSKPKYWEELATLVGKSPSTLNIIFPECYLEDNTAKRIENIIGNMNGYIKDDILREIGDGVVLVERSTENGVRHGLMMLVDLTKYSFKSEDKALIRATEGTVIERIPPRVEIRKNCPLELPHILLLIDDENKTVIEPLVGGRYDVLYDTKLNMNGGKLKGYHIKDTSGIKAALETLLRDSLKKYGESLLFAVGDGNHSLATAKACYKPENPLSRYALVEVENIYDDGIIFEPIHRVVYVDNKNDFIAELNKIGGPVASKLFIGDKESSLNLPASSIEGVDMVQRTIDEYLKKHGGKVDYIHGEGDLREICAETNGVGIVLKPMDKGELFSYIVKKGVLPRKTFSMGEANEKRYYAEVRKIK